MGNLPSSADLSDGVLKRTMDADQQFLGHYLSVGSGSSPLSDAALLSRAYRETLSGVGRHHSTAATQITAWLPPLSHAHTYMKEVKGRRKLEDSESVLQLLPEHASARSRLLKQLQRRSHFLVQKADPHKHIMHARATLLQRYLLAFERWSKREEIASFAAGLDENGQPPASSRLEAPPPETFEDKSKFLELLFARSLEEEEVNSSEKHTSFVSSDEFVAQLFSLIPANLPSEPSWEEEMERMQGEEKEAASNATDSPPPPAAVRMFGLTGLLGLPLQSPSALSAKQAASALEADEPKPFEGEDDASYAQRLHSWLDERKNEQRRKTEQLEAVKKRKREQRDRRQAEKESREKQARLFRQDPASAAVAALDTEAQVEVDPDASLPPEARFVSMQMLEMALEESKQLTLNMIHTAHKEFQQFKSKEKGEEDATPSIYPLSPLPSTHLLHCLLRDLLRKSILCTMKGQMTLRQLFYALKKVLDASMELLQASRSLAQAMAEQEWADFEKQVQYESEEAGSIYKLFASCTPSNAVPNAPPITGAGSASASAAATAGSSSSSSSSSLPSPLSRSASPHAPLLSTLLSTSLLSVITLPCLSYIWTLLFRPVVFEDINEPQTFVQGTQEAAEQENEESEEEKKQEEKKEDKPSAPTFNLFSTLLSFLSELDSFNHSLPSTSSEESLFQLVSDSAFTSIRANAASVVLETPHCYHPDTLDQQVVHIPHASYLVIEFDPRCSTERGRDHLTITVPAAEEGEEEGQGLPLLPQLPTKVAGPFHGPRDQWPKMPLVIQNTNTLVFTFHSDQAHQANTYFGYRAIVTGYNHLHQVVPPNKEAVKRVAEGMEQLEMVEKEVVSTSQAGGQQRQAASAAPTSYTRPFYFLTDQQQTLSHVIGRILRKEIIARSQPSSLSKKAAAESVPDEEQMLAKYLESPLFYNEDAEEGQEAVDEEQKHKHEAALSEDERQKEAALRKEEQAWEMQFLRDLIDGKAGTPGGQLDQLLRKQLQTKRVDMLGGAVTKKVIRLFLAVLLKHLGLTKMAAYWLVHRGVEVPGVELPKQAEKGEETGKEALASPTPISSVFQPAPSSVPSSLPSFSLLAPQGEQDWATLNEQLVEIWKKGQAMHQVIVSGKQLAQQALDNLIAEQEAANKARETTMPVNNDATAPVEAAAPAIAAAASSASSSSSSSSSASASPPPAAAPSAAEIRLAQLARAKAEKLATYEGYTEGMYEKCEYLLSRPSFSHHPLSSFADLANSTSVDTAAPSLDQANETLDMAQALQGPPQGLPRPAVHSMKSLLTLYHSTYHWSHSLESRQSIQSTTLQVFQSLTDLISTFVRDDTPLQTIRRMRRKQVERAKRRAAAMDTLLALLQSLRLHSSHVSLLATFGPPFRAYTSYPLGPEDDPDQINLIGGHWSAHIEASGKKYRKKVRDSFNRLYGYLIQKLREGQQQQQQQDGLSTPSLAFRALVLDSLCIDWHASVRENSWLLNQQLLPLLDSILHSSAGSSDGSDLLREPTPFQQLAANLLKFITINCMHPKKQMGAATGAMAQKQAVVAQKREQEEKEEKAMVVRQEEKSKMDAEDEEKQTSSAFSSSSPTSSPFTFLPITSPVNSAPLDTLQRSVLDRLVTSLQQSSSLLGALRKQGGESVMDSEVVDVTLTPEQKHMLYRRKTRPSASAAVSSSSAQERQAQMAGLLPSTSDEDLAAGLDDLDDISYEDAHPSFPLIRRYLQLEHAAYETLSLLVSLSSTRTHPSYLDYLCTPSVLRTLLLVFVSGSPRMVTLAIRTLAKTLPLVSAFHVREHGLYDFLARADKDEKYGSATNNQRAATPSSSSASSTPFSKALKQSYEPQSVDNFSLGDSLPVPQTLALSRSSSLRARQETDAVLSGDASEEKLDREELAKFVTFLFRRLAELQLATTPTETDAPSQPNTPMGGSSSGLLMPSPTLSPSPSLSHMGSSASKQQKNLNPLSFHTGAMKQTLAAELIMLIRILHSCAGGAVEAEAIPNREWASAIQSFLGKQLLGLSRLVAKEEPRIAHASFKSDVGLALACLSVIGGSSDVLRVGGLVSSRRSKSGSREEGLLLSVDRASNRARVVFRYSATRVVEVELGQLRPLESVPPSPSLLPVTPALLQVFQVFTLALAQEEQERLRLEQEMAQRQKEAEEKRELERLQKQFEEEERKLMDPFGEFRDELQARWPCPAWSESTESGVGLPNTYENPMTKPACEICGQENPSFFIKQKEIEEEVDLEEEVRRQAKETRITLTHEHMLYYQLRSRALKVLCGLLQQPHSRKLLFSGSSSSSSLGQSMLPSLVSMAIRPTHLEVFASVDSLEESEQRLLELLSESALGMVSDHVRFGAHKSQGSDLKYSPFRHLQLHLPSSLDVASARSVQFVGDQRDSLCEVKYMGGGAGGLLSVGLIRANFLVPSSVPCYYFEATIHDMGSQALPGARANVTSPALTPRLVRQSSPVLRALGGNRNHNSLPSTPVMGGASGPSAATPSTPSHGASSSSSSSSAFDLAVGLFRCGMPLEGLPGRHSTYAYSGRQGELHLTRNKALVREKVFPPFQAGDTVGVGVHNRFGQRTVFFTRNGKLLQAEQSSSAEETIEELQLGPNALSEGNGGGGSSSQPSSSSILSISGIDANLSGRFYPAIWFENYGAHVSVNFGQQPFLFDFVNETLPEDYRIKLANMEKAAEGKGGKKLSPQELKRRTMADELAEMMGGAGAFPIELCILALERNGDDMAAAGDWLFSSGTRALEQMAAEALRSQEEKRRGGDRQAADESDSSDEDEDLSDYLVGGDQSQAGGGSARARESAADLLDDEVDADIPMGLDLAPRQQSQMGGAAAGGGRGHPELERQRERARALLQMRGRGAVGEEDLEHLLATMAGLERGAGAASSDDDQTLAALTDPLIYEHIRLDELEAGDRLQVSPAAVRITAGVHGWMAAFAGRVGVVTALNINSQLVTLIFHDPAAGIKRCASFPVLVLQKPQRMWLDPVRDMFERQKSEEDGKEKDVNWQELGHEFVSIEKALSVQQVRRAVLKLIAGPGSQEFSFDAKQLNGPQGVAALLKLTAAEWLSYGKTSSAAQEVEAGEQRKANMLEALKGRLIQLVQQESESLLRATGGQLKAASAIAPPLRITEQFYAANVSDKSKATREESKADTARSVGSSSVKSSSSASSSVLQQGYSSASGHESEDDANSSHGGLAASLRRGPYSESVAEDDAEYVEEDDEYEGEDLPSLLAHEPYDGAAHSPDEYDEEDEDPDGEYDDEEEPDDEYGDMDPVQQRLMELQDFLRHDPSAQGGMHVFRMPGGEAGAGGSGGGLAAMLGFGRGRGGGGGGYIGRSAVPPPPVRPKKKKKAKHENPEEVKAQQASLDELLQQQLQRPRSTTTSSSSSSSSSADHLVSPLLVEEMITHFISGAHHGPPVKLIRSAHPYPSHTEKRGRIYIPGASKLLVRFDPRCQIGTDMLTRLSFYRDRKYQDLILSVQGSGPPPNHCFAPFVVEGDRFYYKFTSGNNSRLWGYKLRVEPIEQRIDDRSALLSRNFELSGWLLDLFLASFPPLFQFSYATELYNAIVWYIVHARPSHKSRGIDMLVRLLFHMRTLMQKEQQEWKIGGQQTTGAVTTKSAEASGKTGSALGRLAELKSGTAASPSSASSSSSSSPPPSSTSLALALSTSLGFIPSLASLPDFHKLRPLSQQMDSVLETLGLGGNNPLQGRHFQRSLQNPPILMALVECLSTVDLLNSEFQPLMDKRKREGEETASKKMQARNSAAGEAESMLSLSPSSSGEHGIDLTDALRDRLRIDKAELLFQSLPGSGDKSTPARKPKDITAEMQKYLSWQNNLQLFIPTDPKILADMPGFENEVSVSTLAAAASGSGSSAAASSSNAPKKAGFHKLLLHYSFLSPHFNPYTQQIDYRVTKSDRKSVSLLASSRPVLLKPSSSRFDRVVSMSRLTLEMKASSKPSTGANDSSAALLPRLPSDFLLEAYRNYHAQKNFLHLIGDRVYESQPNKPRLTRASPSAGPHNGTRSYTLSFWIYLPSTTVPPPREQTFRYIVHAASNLPEQTPLHLSHGMLWPQAGFSLGLGAKDNNLHCIFYEPTGSMPTFVHTRNALQAKRWTHVTLVVSDGVDVTLHIDGSCELTHKFHHALPALPSDPIYVGALPHGLLKLYRTQMRQQAEGNNPPDDPFRVGTGFTGALKDCRLYNYDVDTATFVPSFQEKARKINGERANKNNFHIPVEKPTLASRRELMEVVSGGAQASSFSSSSSTSLSLLPSSSSSSSSVVWTPAMDVDLMELFSGIVAAIRNRRPVEVDEDEDEDNPRPHRDSHVQLRDLPLYSKSVAQVLADEPKLLNSATLINHLPLDVLKQRFACIQLLNAHLLDVLPFVDFSQSLQPWSLAHRLSNLSWLILLEVKNKVWQGLLQATAHGSVVNLTINRPRALKARERGNDPDGLRSVFGQTFQQLHFLRPMMLRTPHGTRPFRVKFSGEGGIDAGGLGRELLSEVCSTLQSRDTPLFIPVPNAAGFGDHSNAWIPNPASTSSLHLSMYAFVGKFMGMAIRGGQVLNFDFPPVIWKLLIAAPIGRQDIQEINALAFKVLDQYAAPALDEDAFNQLPVQHFVTLSSDGREVELKEGGANIPVTFATREEYVRLEEHYRLHEFDVSIAHLRKGLATIVPVHLLSLFTHLEVETLVCGSREISIDMLKRHTEYQRGIRPSDPHVKFLWKVLEEMSQAERQLFLRFVSGQSRLWSDDRDAVKFKLMPAAVDNDITLPVSHTCFFSLELPRYSSQQVMRDKLLYACHNCMQIDADTVADNLDWNDE